MSGDVTVVLSERLTPVTPWEESIATRSGARVETRRLDDQDSLATNAVDATVLIVGAVEPLDDAALARLPQLRLIARRGVGLDNIDVAAATRRGVVLANIPDATVEEVSDHALVLAVTLSRRITLAHHHAQQGDVAAARRAVDASKPLSESTLGLLGCGRIGRRMAEKSAALFADVVVHDPYLDPTTLSAGRGVDAEEVFASADVLSVHVPLTSETQGLVGAAEVDRLPQGAVVVNTSRAGVIDEAALERALTMGHVGGVGLDVTEDESRWRAQIAREANVLLTGHTGARGQRAQTNLRRTCAAQVVAFLAGEKPQHVVNPEAWAVMGEARTGGRTSGEGR